MIKSLPLSSNLKILSSNINVSSPNPNTSDLDILFFNSDITPLSSKSKTKKKQKTTTLSDSSDNETILWPNSTIKSLLAYLSDNIFLYQTNKDKFYLRAAMHLIKGKTGKQVRNKLQNFVTKYMNESSNKTDKDKFEYKYKKEKERLKFEREK
ncbi:18358_t:CDS:2 [Racocetra persica]|uniref:18358_t:CDS:1 n=1 Tax=Racocetra persica TaxID=160502 RepID=A0ACA9KFP7_9GLOM|nr:18358_t:CDS:2 [Racocetra persica]